MLPKIDLFDAHKPLLIFCIGWAAIMLSLTFGIPPVWNTFIHSWKVEFTTSIVLLGLLIYIIGIQRGRTTEFEIPRVELNLIILPVLAIILWSGISAAWAPSWKSAIHHALVWFEYLIFYLLVRQLIDKGRGFSLLLSTPALVLGFYAVLAVISYCTVIVFHGGIPVGMIYARYGEQINTILPLLTIGVLCQTGRRFKTGVVLIALMWLLVFCSSSRTSLGLFIIGILATMGAVFFIKSFQKWRRKMVLIIIAMIAFTVPLYVFSVVSSQADDTILGSRLSDQENMSGSNDFRRLMIAVSLEMISAHPIIGIGADNFGFEVNNYRAIYGADHPDNSGLSQAESEIPERAHNEYLQIVAELGSLGGLLFLWLLCGIGYLFWRTIRPKQNFSPFALAAVIGLAMFLASSLVTSYSFRLIQNGLVFFFVLAVAAKLTFGSSLGKERVVAPSLAWVKLGYAVAMTACVALIAFWGIRVGSVAFTTAANSSPQLESANKLFETAMWLDDENPDARYFLGLRLMDKGRYAEAVPYLKESIRIGKAPSADFSYLASAQSLAGDNIGAEQTFAEAARLYPQSPFVLTRYAALLDANGKHAESTDALNRAKRINLRQANSWWAMITQSPQAAADLALWHDEYVPLMDLKPLTSMYAVKAEREIRHPEEKLKIGSAFNVETVR